MLNLKLYKDHVDSDDEAIEWSNAGISPNMVGEWRYLGVDDPKIAKEMIDVGINIYQFEKSGVGGGIGVSMSVEDLHKSLPYFDVVSMPEMQSGNGIAYDALQWANEGFSPEEAMEWASIGNCWSAEDAATLKNVGLSPQQVKDFGYFYCNGDVDLDTVLQHIK